jgi:cytochrome c oxidase accessory protein FixG
MAVTQTSDPADFRSQLASLDQHGRRRWLYVAMGWGRWRMARVLLASGLIAFYLAVPFLTVDGRPFLRIDLGAKRAIIAGHTFLPQDLSYVVPLVLIAVVATLLTVALVGRFFCGWLCPHNVFLEMVFRPLERLIEGPAHRAAHRDQDAIGGHQVVRKLTKYGLYLLIAGALANTMTAVFIGTEGFRYGLIVDPVTHPSALVFFGIFFGLVVFNFSWFREQTCTILCPYGRFQSVMLDPHSRIVAYDPKRGEPRGKPSDPTSGACVDCHQCVAVCPTGIDIRNGSQLECLHCTACIDACDSIMDRLQRPRGLIAYRSEQELAGQPRRLIRPRTALYATVLVALVGFAIWRISQRSDFLITHLRAGALPVTVHDQAGVAQVRQLVPLSIINRTAHERVVELSLPADLGAAISMPQPRFVVPAFGRVQVTPVIDVPRERFSEGRLDTVMSFASAGENPVTQPLTLRTP